MKTYTSFLLTVGILAALVAPIPLWFPTLVTPAPALAHASPPLAFTVTRCYGTLKEVLT